jgi:hypothetical protein
MAKAEPTVVDDEITIDFDDSFNYSMDVDLGDGIMDFQLVKLPDDALTDDFSSYKSSNKKIATLDKHGNICLKGKTGTVTFTVKGKNSDGKTKTKTLKMKVTDSAAVNKVEIKSLKNSNGEWVDNEVVNGKTTSISLGNTSKTHPRYRVYALDKYGDEIDHTEGEKDGGLVVLKSGNTGLVRVIPKDSEDPRTNRYEEVAVDVSKTGTAKLTATSYKDNKKTAHVTLKVVKHSKEQVVKKQLELELAKAKDKSVVMIGVKDAKINRVKKTDGVITDWYYDVNLYICNGLGHKITKIYPADGANKLEFDILVNKYEDLAEAATGTAAKQEVMGTIDWGASKSVSWKKNAVSTMKVSLHVTDEDGFADLSSKLVELKVDPTFNFTEQKTSPVVYKSAE